MKSLTSIIAIFAVLLLTASIASAQGTATAPSTAHVIDPSTNIVWIGGPNDPINGPNPQPIDLDPNGAPWRKAISVSPNGTFSGGPLFLTETILNVGDEPWTDWHEILIGVSHGVVWGGVTDMRINGSSIGYSSNILGNTVDLDNFSQPVLPGDTLEIDKVIEALTDNVAGPGTTVVNILQYPTTIPEPTSVLLLLLGAPLAAIRRRR